MTPNLYPLWWEGFYNKVIILHINSVIALLLPDVLMPIIFIYQ
jgi:hypothetical protein